MTFFFGKGKPRETVNIIGDRQWFGRGYRAGEEEGVCFLFCFFFFFRALNIFHMITAMVDTLPDAFVKSQET